MDRHLELLARIAQPAESRIVLLVLDGVGDLRTAEQPATALDRARTPNLDQLAAAGALGRIVPVTCGVTPGSGPGHLALFGLDPARPETDIGRGVLEALGLGLEFGADVIAARGNFASADVDGNVTDRRAGRISTAECRRVCDLLQEAADTFEPLTVRIVPGEGHRFVMLARGEETSAAIADTDPQRTEVPPLAPHATSAEGEAMAKKLGFLIELLNAALADEPKANRVLLRGFSRLPDLPSFRDLYKLDAGAFAGYPLYRGVAACCGMEVVPCGKHLAEMVPVVAEHWDRFGFFFLHIKQTDAAGEDGDLEAKVAVLEEVDAALPALMELGPDVVAVTGDHSTPAPMRGHSWHPVPLLVWGNNVFVDDCTEFTEAAATRGHLATFPSREMLGLLLAHAGRLAKYGA
jgi:2,3-bisphosphoglycerate-independent phosphoglycerate mutase